VADTTFVNGSTLTDQDWFNDVNRLHYTIFGDPASTGPLALTLNSTEIMRWTSAGLVCLNDTTNADSTQGFTINQGANDNDILSLKSSDVAHGMTTLFETDSYASFKKVSGDEGGLLLTGLSEVTSSLWLRGFGVTDDTTKSTAGRAYVNLSAGKKSGTTIGAPDANANMVAFMDGQGTTRFIFDADGDSHQDVGTAWTNFDFLDDVATLDALSYNVARVDDPIKQKFGAWMLEKREELARHKLVAFNENGHHFVNMSKLTMLNTGAIRQLAARIERMEHGRLPNRD
jgi:hypothetical protein